MKSSCYFQKENLENMYILNSYNQYILNKFALVYTHVQALTSAQFLSQIIYTSHAFQET